MLTILEEACHEELCQRRSYRSGWRWSRIQEGPSQNKDEYFRLHWISQVSSLKTPKDMFDAMNSMYKDDLENSTQRMWRKHSMIASQEDLISRSNLNPLKTMTKKHKHKLQLWMVFQNQFERVVLVRRSHMKKCTIDWRRDDNQSLTTQAKKKKEEHSRQE